MKKKRLLAVLLTAALLVPNLPELFRVSASETDVTDTLYEEGALPESTDSTDSTDSGVGPEGSGDTESVEGTESGAGPEGAGDTGSAEGTESGAGPEGVGDTGSMDSTENGAGPEGAGDTGSAEGTDSGAGPEGAGDTGSMDSTETTDRTGNTDSTGSGDGSGMPDTAETGAEDDLSAMLQAVPMTESGNDLAAYAVSYDASQENSGLELTVGNALPMTGKVEFTVTLTGPETVTDRASLGSGEKETVIFTGLSDGSYELRLTAPSFADYTQQIDLQGMIRTGEIYTDTILSDGISYTEDGVHPGLLFIGDVDGDGQLTEADRDRILDAAAGTVTVPEADLNRDGRVDLADLQYFANSCAKRKLADTKAVFTGRIAPGAVGVSVDGSTKITSGDPAQLLEDSGSLQLMNAAEAEITEEHPVELTLQVDNSLEQMIIATGENGIENGVIVIETEDGKELEIAIVNGVVASGIALMAVSGEEAVTAYSAGGPLVINLGDQIAVKKVTIRVTKTKGTPNLVEISRVEFLNDMENRIPAPEMNIPLGLTAKGSNKAVLLTWEEAANVTGYEVRVTHDGKEQIYRAASPSLKLTSFGGKDLVNQTQYTVQVQSVNGTWRSGYGEAVTAVPRAEGRPEAPDYLKASGAYRKIKLSWKQMEDTDSYNVYYRVKGTGEYTKVTGITANSYEITELVDRTTYEVYVTGVNELGESAPSLISEAVTTVIIPATLPKYRLINESCGTGQVTSHIVSAAHYRGEMIGSSLDTDATSALGVVDDDYSSYYYMADWDEGGVYPSDGKGIYVTFDQKYKINYIAFAEVEDIVSYTGGSLYYYEENHKTNHAAQIAAVLQKTDANGRKYYVMKLAEPVESDMLRVGFTRYGAYRNITIAEMAFYYYDSLEDDVLALYADDLHTSLKAEVTEETIAALQKRLDTVDEKSGEYHPERESIQKELDNAKGLLETTLGDTIQISSKITAAKDGHVGFGGLNAWQPLGVSAYAGEQVVIYVGHDSLQPGAGTALQLIATQYHAESSSVKTVVANLKVGRNEVTIPKLQSLAAESGGALYVQYTGNNASDRYAVRVSGGVKIPVLNLYGVTDEAERSAKVLRYVEELEDHVARIEKLHNETHATAPEASVNRAFDEQNCIAGATDIMLDQMMYSVSAKQILAALGSGTTDEKAQKLDQSLKAMDQMMHLFYQHKGLTDEEGASAKDRLPSQHLNIRYMRMFAGAFMYAAGDHIGIEWGSVGGLATAVPIESENGKYVSGNLFGWGIAHEIGHNINQNAYAVAEITNNYFAQLITARDTNASARWKYADVYEKVTSGTLGDSPNQATQLAMYWQLHLAYDRDYNFKTYDTYAEQFANLFYARMDTYARDTSRAPAPGGVALTLGGTKDQVLMRLACAAAEKDVTEFFIRWGKQPDADTLAYAAQFAKEERAIYYLTDEDRVYEMENGTAGNIKGKNVITSSSSAVISRGVPGEVTLTIDSSVDAGVLAGYEIARYTCEGGVMTREVAGFAPADGSTAVTYKDHVATVNNRVVTYDAIAVDKFGYQSKAKEIGAVRISHDGSLDKALWGVETNMTSAQDTTQDATEKDPCDPIEKPAVAKVIDYNYNEDTYIGQADGADAYVLIDMKKQNTVCGLKYTVTDGSAITDFVIEISTDGQNWRTVREGSFTEKTRSETVYFQNEKKDPWVATFDAVQVRLTAKGSAGKQIAITEIDLLGPSGDSVLFGSAEGKDDAVGILAQDYEYESGRTIPAGSLVFTGRYKGNPAYNVVLLYDEKGNIVGGLDENGETVAEQIILAKVPENGLLGEVSEGTWIYWIEPDAAGNVPKLSGKVRAELYRVDNALTNEGQRLVSDTLPLEIPAKLGEIRFQ